MVLSRSLGSCVLVVVAASLSFVSAGVGGGSSPDGDVAAQFWNQDHGSGAADGFVDVAPVLSMPEEVWRTDIGEILSGPVVWGGDVFCAVAKGRQANLVRVDAETGKVIGKTTLGKVDDPRIAVWQGIVAVCTADYVRTYKVKGRTLRKDDTIKLQTQGPVCIAGRSLFVADLGSRLHVIDLRDGKDTGTIGRCEGRPAVTPTLAAIFEIDKRSGYGGEFLSFRTLRRSSEDQRYKIEQHKWGGLVRRTRRGSEDEAIAVLFLEDSRGAGFYVRPRQPLEAAFSDKKLPGAVFTPYSNNKLSPILVGPIAWEDGLIGFNSDGDLMGQDKKGVFRTVVDADKRPKGMRVGPLTRARNVAYAGNMAVHLETDRVLWCAADLDTEGPLIPLADARILYVSNEGELVCAGSSSANLAAAGTTTIAFGAVPAPSDGDGLVLADGTFRRGPARARIGGGAIFERAGEDPEEFERDEVSLVIREGEVELVGEEFPVFEAFRRSLLAEEASFLEDCFTEYYNAHLGDECRRILGEYQRLGLPMERHGELLKKLAGRSENTASNRGKKLAKVRRIEDEGRARIASLYHGAAAWCVERNLRGAATLLEDALAVFDPDAELDFERIATWMPDAFPFRNAPDAGKLWLRWAHEILPAGAHFVPRDDESIAEGWAQEAGKETLALRTRNLLFLSRSTDPEVVGLCLRSGEGAVRMLGTLFPESEAFKAPMEVRLHPDHESFLAELKAAGAGQLEWAAGYFNPAAKASTFYLPDDKDRGDALQDLRSTLDHELTHQFLAERAVFRSSGASRSGVWAVEGIARFFEEQAVELGRADRSLDDETVPSIDASSQLLEADKLIPLERLLLMNKRAFSKLGDVEIARFSLRYTLQTRVYTERSVFYDESGALVFFLLQRAGRQVRQGMLDYLKAVYSGEWDSKSWELLGFDSIDTLEEAFHAFLQEAGG